MTPIGDTMFWAPTRHIATMAVAAIVASVLFFAAPAGAQNDTITAEITGCPPFATYTAVVDGQTTTVSPNVAALGGDELTIPIPNGVPGNVLVVICTGIIERTEAVNIVVGATSCPPGFDPPVGTYVVAFNLLCLKVTGLSASQDAPLPSLFGWSAAGAGTADGQVFQPVYASDVAAAAPLGAEVDLTASIDDRSTPWVALQLGAAAAVLGALGLFTLRRRGLSA